MVTQHLSEFLSMRYLNVPFLQGISMSSFLSKKSLQSACSLASVSRPFGMRAASTERLVLLSVTCKPSGMVPAEVSSQDRVFFACATGLLQNFIQMYNTSRTAYKLSCQKADTRGHICGSLYISVLRGLTQRAHEV